MATCTASPQAGPPTGRSSKGGDTSIRTARIMDGAAWLAWGRTNASGRDVGGGACDVSRERAVARAAGELTERTALLEASAAARDIRTTAPERVRRHGLKELLGYRASTRHWVCGYGAGTREPAWLPAQAALFGYPPPHGEPRCVQTTIGVAAGATHGEAVASGIAEVIERDAVRRLLEDDRVAVTAERIGDFAWVSSQRLNSALRRRGLSPHGYVLRLEGLVVALVALAGESSSSPITLGAACRDSGTAALMHGLLEALSMRVALANGARTPRTSRQALKVARLNLQRAPSVLRRLQVLSRPTSLGKANPRSQNVTTDGWVEAGTQLFGNEPVIVPLSGDRRFPVVRVVCPGSGILISDASTEDLVRTHPLG